VKTRGQHHPRGGVIPAQGVNTLGEVMDGEWYVNRQTPRRMTIAELKRGPKDDLPPAAEGAWQVLVVKPFGVNPGLLVADGERDRAVATRLPERREALLGPYQYWGTRSDDPNDTVPHEHRRDLRGLYVFSAWLNNSGARAVDTHDILTPIDGIARIRHYIVDFTRSLGSGSVKGPKLVWEGHEPFLAGRDKMRGNILGFGVVTPGWMKE